MEAYMRLLRAPGKQEVILVPTGRCHGRIRVDEPTSSFTDEEPVGTDYKKEVEAKEMNMYEEAMMNPVQTGAFSVVDTINGVNGEEDCLTRSETVKRIYSDYVFVKSARAPLPIDSLKQKIIDTLKLTNVIIIQGETGCGKTTQVPQFIMDVYREAHEYCNIIVTQPRKLAAVSVAKRVCDERGWQVGSICGYQVGLEKMASADTILTYVTAGVLLQKLILRKDLNEYTHIIIDEVHERTQEMDFLLIILRRFLNTNSMGVKIILMSATFDTSRFANYFRSFANGIHIPATSLQVSKQDMHTKTIHYLDEMPNLGEIPEERALDDPHIHPLIFNIFVKLISALKQIDMNEIGHVLVFLPGIYEIEIAYNLLMKESAKNSHEKFMVVPLHSSIPAQEQSKVFRRPDPGVRKIILSTNIAESSITVPDVVYVIDFCLTKVMAVDPVTQYQSLQLTWASKTNCIQRAGRVGRVRAGRVYRLVHHSFYEDLPMDVIPEMLRAPLDRMVLYTKKLELNELPHTILGLAMDPPDLRDIRSTIKSLKEIGGLLPTCREQYIELDGDITMLGIVMCNLPLDVRLAKLICLGYIFSCLTECVIMAAGCSLPNIFSTPFNDRLQAYINKMIWADGSCSDLLAHLRLYQTFQNNKNTGVLKNPADEKEWCRINYLSYRSMKEWEILVTEIQNRLDHIHIKPIVGPTHVTMTEIERTLILKIAIAGAFYPNYFSRSCDGGQVDEKTVYSDLKGLSALTTVYFHNMDPDQPGPLYEQRIKEIVRPVSNDVDIYFDNSSKVYVSFNDKRKMHVTDVDGRKFLAIMPGKVAIDVYKAIRMRQLRMNTTFPVLTKRDAWDLANSLNIATREEGYNKLIRTNNQKKKTQSVLPALHQSNLFVTLSHVIDAGHFYAQPTTQECSKNLETLVEILNDKEYPLDLVGIDDVEVDKMYACQFSDKMFYRCRVVNILPRNHADIAINIVYIDYGNTETVKITRLFQLPKIPIVNIPPQAMECVLCGVQPTVAFNPRGTWSTDANEYFQKLTRDVILMAKVYSVVNEIVSVELYRKDETTSINMLLVKERHGIVQNESYLSNENHELRLQAREASIDYTDVELNLTNPLIPEVHVDAPDPRYCKGSVTLRGPFSPLEMKVYSMGNKSSEDVKIDQTSINTVLLDYEPQDPHERFLVATYIAKSPRNNALTLRHTTLMPNIHGLPALVALIFAPTVLIKASTDGTSFASILCGLGKDDRNRTIYAEHDLKVVLDVEITKQDLTSINEIRFIMNKLLEYMKMSYEKIEVDNHLYHRFLKERLIKLFTDTRESKNREMVPFADSWIKNAYEGNILKPSNEYNRTDFVWPLHYAIELIDEDDEVFRLKRHLEDLTEYVRGYKDMPDQFKCLFCDSVVVTFDQLRGHIITTKHQEKVSNFKRVYNIN